MSMSVEGAVGASVALENASVRQEAQMTLLKKVLDNRASSIATLIDGATAAPKAQGMVGSRVNTYA